MKESSPDITAIRTRGVLEFVQSLLEQGLSTRFKVSGESMLPLMSGGEILEISGLRNTKRSLAVGDLLLYIGDAGNLIVHRLIRKRYYDNVLYLQTKGDACASFDPFIPVQQVLGRVVSIEIPSQNRAGKQIVFLNSRKIRFRSSFIVCRTLVLYYLFYAPRSALARKY